MTVTGVDINRDGIRRLDLYFRVLLILCRDVRRSPSLAYSFAVNLRFWLDTGCFWSRAHVFKELKFVARSLPRLERRTFSCLELAS